MLRGQSILRPNPKEDGKPANGDLLPMPNNDQMRKFFDDKVRDAFAGLPSALEHHYQGARAIYAALSVDAGDVDTSILDSKRWERAIELATGGFVDHGGRRVPRPYGFTDDQFRDGHKRRIEDLAASGRLHDSWGRLGTFAVDTDFHLEDAVERLRGLPLEPVGDGRYALKVGDAYLVDKRGERVVLDFGRSAFRESGHGKPMPDEPLPTPTFGISP
jgi:hypothetical protein